MSKDYFKIIELLNTNQIFLKTFINNPVKSLENYKLSGEERKSFLARSLHDVKKLGKNKTPKSAIRW